MPGRCGRKLANIDRYCIGYPVHGKERCRKHGGGPNMGRPVIDGRQAAWNRALGPTWKALKTVQVRNLDTNAQVMLAREAELRERLEDGDSTGFRKSAVDLLNEVRAAGARNDGPGLGRALTALENHLKRGVDRDGVWEDILAIEERHAAIVEKASKIETAAGNCLTGTALVGLLGTVFDLVAAEAGEQIAFRVGCGFDRIIAKDLPSGPAFQALPALAASSAEGPAEVPE